MPRKNRRESGTGVYHVIARGNNKEKIFERVSDKRLYIRVIHKGCEIYQVKIYGYCIMVNHVHILLEAHLDELAKFMRYINSTYAEQFNMKYDRCGHVFQGRYYSDCVETEEYYWCCLRYIHNNPVKIFLVDHPYDYEFSSAVEYLKKTSELIHGSAYEMLKTRFQNENDFWGFHSLFEQKTFLDTVEDELIYNRERVKNMAKEFMLENDIRELQTLLNLGAVKKPFLEQCKKITGISERKIQNILTIELKGD